MSFFWLIRRNNRLVLLSQEKLLLFMISHWNFKYLILSERKIVLYGNLLIRWLHMTLSEALNRWAKK